MRPSVRSITASGFALLICGALHAEEPCLSGIVLTTDRTIDCTSHQTIAKAVWHDGMNEQQKAYAMWRFFISRNMHKEIASPCIEDPGNASELLIKSAYSLCGDWATRWANCMADNGMQGGRVFLNGHTIGCVDYWGDTHAYDTDMQALYVKPDGIVANPKQVDSLKDSDGKLILAHCGPIKSYPWYLGPDSVKESEDMYKTVHLEGVQAPHEHRNWVYNLVLRQGQEIIWSWHGDPDVGMVCLSHLPSQYTKKKFNTLRAYLEGDFDYYTQTEGKPKWNWGYRRGGLPPNPLQTWNGVDGNGRLIMDVGANGFKNALAMVSSIDNLEVSNGKLALKNASKPGNFVLDFSLPYAYGDAWVAKPLPEKGLKIELSTDNKTYQTIYPTGGVDDGQRIRLFDCVRCKPKFWLKTTLDAGSTPLEQFKAIGVFNFACTVAPSVLKGQNNITVRLADPVKLNDAPLHVTYVYDQVSDDHKIMRTEKVFTFTPDHLTQSLDTGDKHWPLMREIRMQAGGPAPKAAPLVEETGECDWAAAPWPWIYYGVNFWNDFARGDRQGWSGRLTTRNTPSGHDFVLDNSLMTSNGTRQLKLIRFGSFLNRDSHFRCLLWVKNVEKLTATTRNQDPVHNETYFSKEFSGLKDGSWQTLEFAFNELSFKDKPENKVQNNWFLGNIYLQVTPASDKNPKDVEFMIADTICWDGILKNDPLTDPDAPEKALAEDPIWNAQKPEK